MEEVTRQETAAKKLVETVEESYSNVTMGILKVLMGVLVHALLKLTTHA